MSIETQSVASEISLSEPRDYFTLMKPRVMRLVVFTALVGMLLAPGPLDPVLAVVAIVCIAIGAGASGALNMWYDADIDAVMSRTSNRPIPFGSVSPNEALNFGMVLSVLSVLTLGLLVNWVAGALLAFTIFFYAVIYTMWLKRSTPQNIVIGGAAGAFPPMIGWSVVSGSITMEAIVLFAIIFFWTPPHFWALALFKMRDYDDANVPMLPNVAGETATRNQMMIYSILLLPLSIAPYWMGFASPVYGAVAAALSGLFLFRTWQVWADAGRDETFAPARKLFLYSIFYLFAIFGALLLEAVFARFGGLFL